MLCKLLTIRGQLLIFVRYYTRRSLIHHSSFSQVVFREVKVKGSASKLHYN
jgi:hypothetical protein